MNRGVWLHRKVVLRFGGMAAGIAPDTAPANELDELVRAKVAGLRPKLLDLTRVNPLISAKLSPRSASLVRIVDELPDVVFYDITSGERLQIVPLPNLDTEPADERTREFTDRLANARLTDADYLAAIDALDDDAEDFPNRAQAIERTLKDRVRASLNLPARPAGDDVNLVQHARAHGISPSYDLPVPDDEEKPAHHDDRLQTLFLPRDLERKLNAILSKCRTWQQETGLNVLHVAYGLLEWAEAAASTHSFAPLVLNEASLAREKTVRGAEFWIEGTGAEPETNTVLSEKLRLEFDIALPPFAGGSIEDYLEQIGSLAPKSMPVWRVRRQIIVGVFPSARMAMYRDLDPAGLRMGQDDVVSQLLAGHDTGEASPFAPEYEIDHPDIEKQVPRLISEADASQFSALVDIAGGRNLALEGPPGTGKSQTIVNAIAGAIGAGKKVLFVAEKLAALNVVKSRLEAAGLGEFLLPLQADRSTREQVIESIRERLDMEVEKPSRDHEAKVKEFRRVRDELAVYLKLMASEFQGSHLRVRDILGRTTAATQRLDALPREVVSACNISADVLSADGIDRIRRHAERLNEAHRHTLSAHPAWRSTKLTNPDRFTVEEICGQAATLGTRFRELATERALLQQAGLFADLSAEQLKDIASVLALVPGDAPKQALLAVLNPASSSVVRELHRRCTDITEATQSLQPMFAVELDDSCLQAAQAIADACDGVPLDSVHDEDVQSEIDNQRKLVQFAQGLTDRLAAFVAQRPESRGWMLRDFATAHGLVKAAGRAGLSLRKDRLSDHDPETIVILCDEIRRLRDEKVQLAKGLAAAGNLPAETLQDFAAALRTSGVLSIFSSAYRGARRLYKSFAADRRFDAAEAAGELEKLASFQRRLASLDAKPDARTIFGGRFHGLDTEFAPFEALGRFYLAVEDIGHAEVRKFLREASVAELETLPHLQIPPAVGELTFDLIAAAIPRSKSSIAALEQAATALRSHTHVLADPRSVGSDDLRDMASRLQRLIEQRQAADSHAATDLLGPMFAGAGTDLDLLSRLTSWSDEALSHAQHLTPVIQGDLAEAARTRAETVQGLETTTACMLTALVELAKVDAELLAGSTSHHDTAERLLQAGNDPEGLYHCASSSVLAAPLDQAGFRTLREHLAAHAGTLHDLAGACEALILRQLAKNVYEHHGPQLGTFVGSHLDSQRRLVASLDRELIALGRKDLRARVKDAARPPRGNGTGKKSTFTEMALIDNEISKSKRYAPVRDLTQRAGRALQELKPCWMMSPLAVAQYVPRNTIKFDLCIIDEASQMPPESALGALMRASQTVVVGDTNQLPPSNFFRTVVDDEDDDEDETVLNESILEMANATFRPPRRLRWHYRSRHSALIAFSNRLVYDDDLVVFPSADEGSKRMGVELREVPGLYKSGTNPVEAQALVDATMAFMRSDPDRSLGIVTLNQKQRELVREEFEARSAGDTQVQDYLERWREQNDGLEEFFIKNLENVQGDERDVIFIGTVYGRETEGTRVMQRFGPINGLAGRRRLNVLFTRAKEKVVTFSSMTSADIVADENGNAGAYMLKRWLEYARTGVLEAGKTTKREPDSEFEVYVINQIKAMGCEPVPQVGVAGYFIDIGIRHPQWPHGYLLGVECDGANYHSAKSARDRDRLRQEVLEGLGWRLHRIWSTDWFNNPHREADRLRQAIAQRLEQLKAKEQDYVRPDPAPNTAAAATPISGLSARASERPSRSGEEPGRETTQVRGHRQPASDTRTSRDQPLTVATARDMGVSIGDTVRVTYLAGGKQVSVRVTRDKSDASNGIIHCETPLAKALLGAEEGEEISVLIRNQVQRARVEEIIRPSLGR